MLGTLSSPAVRAAKMAIEANGLDRVRRGVDGLYPYFAPAPNVSLRQRYIVFIHAPKISRAAYICSKAEGSKLKVQLQLVVIDSSS